jgi:hypothetical protein
MVNAACMHGKLEWRSCVCVRGGMHARGPTRLFGGKPDRVLFFLTAYMVES